MAETVISRTGSEDLNAAIREDPGPLKLVTSRTGSEDLNHNTTNTLTPPPSHFPHGERGFQCGQLIQKKDGRKD